MAVFYRICKREWAESAMSGEGARLYGGRWNDPGIAVVYLADSRALAALEILVHATSDAIGLDWVVMDVEVPDGLIDELMEDELPEGWDRQPVSKVARGYGEMWLKGGKKLALKVPSAVIPEERTVVLNVRHEGMKRVKVSEPRAFPFDRRLMGKF